MSQGTKNNPENVSECILDCEYLRTTQDSVACAYCDDVHPDTTAVTTPSAVTTAPPPNMTVVVSYPIAFGDVEAFKASLRNHLSQSVGIPEHRIYVVVEDAA